MDETQFFTNFPDVINLLTKKKHVTFNKKPLLIFSYATKSVSSQQSFTITSVVNFKLETIQ